MNLISSFWTLIF